MSIIKPETKLVNFSELEKILQTHKVSDTKQITDDSFIVTYENEISKDILTKSGIDLAKLLNENNSKDLETNNKFGFVSVPIAAAITAYARIYINKIKI
jgi:hypothetical protein